MSIVAYIVINGLQPMACKAPTVGEQQLAVGARALERMKVMNDHGKFELSTLFYSANASAHAQPYVADLVIDDERLINLGRLPPNGESVIVTRYVDRPPKRFAFRLRVEATYDTTFPDEDLLLEEVLKVLLDPRVYPPGGAGSHAAVYNRVKELDLYNRVIHGHYHGRWMSFLERHHHAITVLKIPGKETQIMLRGNEAGYVVANQQHLADRMLAEANVVGALVDALSEQHVCTYTELLGKLEACDDFTSRLMPSATMLSRFLAANRDIFWVKRDPEHTTRVGLVRPGVTTAD
jgi:hypothetical protein